MRWFSTGVLVPELKLYAVIFKLAFSYTSYMLVFLRSHDLVGVLKAASIGWRGAGRGAGLGARGPGPVVRHEGRAAWLWFISVPPVPRRASGTQLALVAGA